MRYSKLAVLFSLIVVVIICEPALAQTSHAPVQPIQFQRAKIFIDGTNLFYRLEAMKIEVINLLSIIRPHIGRRDLVRAYLYTIPYHFERAKKVHQPAAFDGLRIVYGEGIPTADGNIKEKGVDALLVTDLIYHAANKNCDYALLVSADQDFVRALQRIEDFGCRTGVLAIGSEAPDSLRSACDNYTFLDKQSVLGSGNAIPKV